MKSPVELTGQMAEFCSRCGKTLSLIDPLLELKGLRFCEDCYPDVKREHAAQNISEKLERKQRVAFADDDSDDNLRGAIIKGKQALASKESEFKWDNPSLSLIASALRILTDQNRIIMKQNELILRELENRVQPVKSK
ncbi:MAG TPA: hypothetical protein VIH83_05345 [Candidatus Bathyarchaeia archaeon]